MSMFSQSLCIGENTLQELEKGADVGPTKVSTPSRTCATTNSDVDIIDESPTNHASGYSLRERTKAKHFNKSKSKNKKVKSRSCEQLATTEKVAANNTLSQFFRSEFDFSGNPLLPGITSNVNFIEKLEAKIVENVDPMDSDMFEDWIVPQNIDSNPSAEIKVDEKTDSPKIVWDDSYDFNDVNLSVCKENNIMEMNLKVDEQIVLGLDNVTFTQNFMNEASFENDLNLKKDSNSIATCKFIEEEMESCRNSFTSEMLAENEQQQSSSRSGQISSLNFNISESSFSLNYSDSLADSTAENDDKPVVADNLIEKLNSQPLKHLNSMDSWGLPSSIVREYHRKNIFNMFDWQRECLSNPKVLLENSNLVYCAPTSAGKTLVSEILMIKNVLEKQKKVLIILPFVSVVREKMNYLQDLLTSTGIQVEGYFGGYSPRNFDSVHVAVCTIEKANSILNKLLEKNKINSIGCIVVDEVHLISDPSRGYILELLLAKILYVNQKIDSNIQIITMSATLPNLDLLTNWLRAEFYHTDFRPVELKEMIKINNQIFDNKLQLLRTISDQDFRQFPKDPDNIGQMCVETILESGSVIVFCPSKDWCETLSNHLAGYIFHIGTSKTDLGIRLRAQINLPLIEETKAQLRNCPTGLDSVLERTMSYGCAFHHAGLTSDERDIIETAFKMGSIRIIIATSTLSSGVNLPARRVIIRSPLFGGKTMNALTYKQMIGRAGRTGKDSIGESILICDSRNKRSGEDLIVATLKPLSSCLAMDSCVNLKRAVLEVIASGMGTTKADLEAFCDCTLLSTEKHIKFKCEILENEFKCSNGNGSQEQDQGNCSDPIGTCMRFLLKYEFIRLQMNENTREMNFIATRLGNACLASSMPPGDGFLLFSELQKSRQSFVLETDLHAIYLVTPISICYQMQDIDWMCFLDMWEKLPASKRRVGELVGVKEAFFVKAVRGHKLDFKALQIHKRFYTSLALEELVSEKHVTEVAQKFKCSRGLLQSLQQMASTFAGTVTSFCHALNWTMLANIITQFKERLFFGVHHDLVDLMKIPNLNNQRARSLFKEGIQSLADLANSDVFTIEKILYNSICFDTKQRDGENKWDAEQRNKLRFMFVTGKAGLTVRESAIEMIESARRCLELEMGVENIVWSKHSQKLLCTNSQTNNLSDGVRSPVKIKFNSQQSSNSQNHRKRKLDDDESNSSDYLVREQLIKKYRAESSQSDSDIENELLGDRCIQMNSVAVSLDTDDQDEFAEELTKYKELNVVNVFESLEFFKQLQATIKNCSVVGVSVGVNQLLKVPPIIGLSTLVNQVNREDENIECYNCTFGDQKFIAGISLCLCDKADSAVYYLNLQNEAKDDVAISFDMKIQFLVDLFHMKQITLDMYDAKEQCKVLVKCIPQLSTLCAHLRDPLVANWLLLPDVDRNLLTMVRKYAPACGHIIQMACIDKWNSRSISLNCGSAVSPKIRSAVESYLTIHVMKSQMEHLHKMESNMAAAFVEIEMPIQRVLMAMENAGFPVDGQRLSEVASELTETLKTLESIMFRIHGRSFNLKSSEEVAKVLGLSVKRCPRRILEKHIHPISKLILQHRTVSATLTKCIQPLIRQIINQRIYPRSFSFTSTGRITLYEPNLQSVTNDFEVTSDSGPKTISCRRAFKAHPGCELLSADFCQLELRILTHFSNDQTLTEIMRSDCDVFKMIAAKWNNINEADVTDKQRNDSKQICYGIIYGMGVKTLAEKMNCEEAEAEKHQALFHKCYPGIRVFAEKVIARTRECGFVETISGRRRYLPNIASNEASKRAEAERQALNSLIQGSAADIAKKAMLSMDKCLSQRGSHLKNVNLVLHVHDELVYESPKVISKEVIKKLKSSMENYHTLNVPLRVKIKKGKDWGTMHVIGC